MGDMADYYREIELEKHLNMSMYDDFEETPVDYTVWTTKSGGKLHVNKMSDAHLLNTINYINKNLSHSEEWFDILITEALKRNLTVPNKNPYFGCDASELDIY